MKTIFRTQEESQELIDALEESGFETRSYSGRAMYGKECVAVSGDDLSAWDVAKALFSEVHDGEFDNLPAPRQDQLGLGIVLYWPQYEWPKEAA